MVRQGLPILPIRWVSRGMEFRYNNARRIRIILGLQHDTYEEQGSAEVRAGQTIGIDRGVPCARHTAQ